MNKYLIDILNEIGSVIIPDLGKLTKKAYSSGLIHVTFEIIEESDDEEFANFISSRDGVGLQETKNAIAKYVSEIKAELTESGVYLILGLGKFSRTDAGNIYFITSNEAYRDVSYDTAKNSEVKEDKVVKDTANDKESEDQENAKSKVVRRKTAVEDNNVEEKESDSESVVNKNTPDSTETENDEVKEDKKEETVLETPEKKEEESKEHPEIKTPETKEEETESVETIIPEAKEVQPEITEVKEPEVTEEEADSNVVSGHVSEENKELVGRYLLDILKNKKEVIVSNLGKFTAVTDEKGFLQFDFDSSVKSGDGHLAAYLVVKEKMPEQEVTDSIAAYIKDIDQGINENGYHTIHGLGKFEKDHTGKKVFTMTNAPVWVAQTDQELNQPEPRSTQEESNDHQESVSNEEGKVVEENNATTESVKSESVVAKKEVKEESKKNISKEKENPKSRRPEKPVEKRKSKLPLIIILVVVLGGGGVAGYIFMEQIKSFANGFMTKSIQENMDSDMSGTEMEADTADASDTWVEDGEANMESDGEAGSTEEGGSVDLENLPSKPFVEEVETPKKKDVVENKYTSSSGKYHVIGNVFSVRENADNYVSEMKAKGYSAQIVAELNGNSFVAVQSFETKQEALDNLEKILTDAPEAWVFKYPK